jgi:hypothetical protein
MPISVYWRGFGLRVKESSNFLEATMADSNNKEDLRKSRNEELIRRMKAGESLWSYDSKASWFPPRPIIEKDKDAIKRLYKDSETSTFKDPTVRHIDERLKVIQAEITKHKKEDVG